MNVHLRMLAQSASTNKTAGVAGLSRRTNSAGQAMQAVQRWPDARIHPVLVGWASGQQTPRPTLQDPFSRVY